VLRAWVEQSCPPLSSRLEVAAKAVGLRGKRSDLLMLPASNGTETELERLCSDARYDVARRSLD